MLQTTRQSDAPSPTSHFLDKYLKDSKGDFFWKNSLDVLYDTYKIAILSNYFGSIAIVLYIYSVGIEYRGTIIWAGLIYIANTGLVIAKYRRSKSDSPNDVRWLIASAMIALSTGILYGSLPYFISTDNVIVNISIQTLMSLFIVGGALIYSVVYQISPLYYTPLILLSSFHSINSDHSELRFFGYLFPIWLVTCVIAYRGYGKYINKSISLSIKNEELVEQLKKEKQEAENATLSKSRFLAAASHDLRQPLHALGIFVSQLGKNLGPSEQNKLNHEIKISVKALRAMLDSLLDLSSIDSENIRISRCDFFLDEIFKNIHAEYQALSESKGVELKIIHPKHIRTNSDPTQLERMIRNLVFNAIQYTNHGKVVVGVRHRQDHYEIQILDTGIGISSKHLEKIFDEFYQISNPERDREKGVGLGLSIVSRLSKLLNHGVKVNSIPGKGSCFSISIPKSIASIQTKSDPTLNESLLDGKIVLVIDDDTSILSSMRLLLEGWRGTIFTAESGEEALKLMDDEGILPDIVIVDYRLRDNEKGDAALIQLNLYMETTLKAILITGDLKVSIADHPSLLGLTIMHKPVDTNRLNYELSKLI